MAGTKGAGDESPDGMPEGMSGPGEDQDEGLEVLASVRFRRRRWPIILVCAVCVVALVLGALSWMHVRYAAAQADCESAISRRDSAVAAYRRALTAAASASTVTTEEVGDGSVVTALGKTLSDSRLSSVRLAGGQPGCTGRVTPGVLRARARAADRSSTRARASARDLAAAAKAVTVSRDARTLSDAQNDLATLVASATTLFESSRGNVSDEATRTALSDAIARASLLVSERSSASRTVTSLAAICREQYAALEKTIADVNDSITDHSGVDCDRLACIALTFDDGPNSSSDSTIRDELEKLKVKATFFMIGSTITSSDDSVIARDVKDGNLDGNHSWTHPDLTTLDARKIASQLTKTDRAITDAGGVLPGLVRPPYGSWNDTVRDQAAANGDAVILWNVDSEDWKNRNAAATTKRVVDGARAGSIVLMHSIYQSTAEALPGIVSQLRAKGYTLVTVAQLLGGSPKAGWVYYGQHDMIHPGQTKQVEE
ncbi:polysaccharide deacetylase family protein [uncultured Bifidobacterium sp.]|uniref:polysaccharide deacetylase family protein n=1 Tax=uncultured Bifidobacterium sp. TaxID=165187 RepID=UPI0028DCB0BB|nr:polysaccharide deacetylase family protein [uncultured Bifidobacterium sp.]